MCVCGISISGISELIFHHANDNKSLKDVKDIKDVLPEIIALAKKSAENYCFYMHVEKTKELNSAKYIFI